MTLFLSRQFRVESAQFCLDSDFLICWFWDVFNFLYFWSQKNDNHFTFMYIFLSYFLSLRFEWFGIIHSKFTVNSTYICYLNLIHVPTSEHLILLSVFFFSLMKPIQKLNNKETIRFENNISSKIEDNQGTYNFNPFNWFILENKGRKMPVKLKSLCMWEMGFYLSFKTYTLFIYIVSMYKNP